MSNHYYENFADALPDLNVLEVKQEELEALITNIQNI